MRALKVDGPWNLEGHRAVLFIDYCGRPSVVELFTKKLKLEAKAIKIHNLEHQFRSLSESSTIKFKSIDLRVTSYS